MCYRLALTFRPDRLLVPDLPEHFTLNTGYIWSPALRISAVGFAETDRSPNPIPRSLDLALSDILRPSI